jgi:hypothetical protein
MLFAPLTPIHLGCLKFYFPRLHTRYREAQATLHGGDAQLHRNWPNSVYAAAAFNLGPQAICWPHKDAGNLWHGQCAITSGGSFDHAKGGHLVLHELKLIVQFPPGSTALIPSSVITHENLPIQDDEWRVSFTQYTPGALFRWVDYGLRTEKTLRKQDPCAWKAMCAGEAWQRRFEEGLSTLSFYDSLAADRRAYPV